MGRSMRRILLWATAVVMSVGLVSCKSTPKTDSGSINASPTDIPALEAVPSEGAPGAGPARPATTETPRPHVVGGVVAVVNSDIVTREEVLEELAPQFAKLDTDASLTEEGRRAKRAELVELEVRFKVERLLALQEARRRLNEQQQAKIERDVDYYIKGLIRSVGSSAQLEKQLSAQGKTIEIRKSEEVENRMLAALWDQETGQHTFVRPAERRAYYENHRSDYQQKRAVQIRQIFVDYNSSATKEGARDFSVGLLARLKKGEDFAHLAQQYSDDPNASQGGLWKDYLEEGSGQVRPEVEKAAFAMAVKQTSPLIESDIGYHIIKVEDVRPERLIPYSEVEDQITDTLRNAKMEQKRREVIDRLWKNSYVRIQWK